jgi:hypothetical protein
VLAGLGLLNQGLAREHMAKRPELRRRAGQAVDSLTAEYRHAAPQALGHRDFLTAL